jgi:hypothetical protein
MYVFVPHIRCFALLAIMALTAQLLVACATTQPNPMRLGQSSEKFRVMQTRTFDLPSEQAILNASVNVLLDMNYRITEIDRDLGVLSASRKQDDDKANSEKHQQPLVTALDWSCILIILMPCSALNEIEQQMNPQFMILTLVVTPGPGKPDSHSVRLSMQSTSHPGYEVRPHPMTSTTGLVIHPKHYQAFFDQLSKSVFLETNL